MPQTRLLAIGDIHGHATELVAACTAAGLIDPAEAWIAPDVTLVTMGDVIDRGPDSKGVVDRLVRWQQEAPAHGSRLVSLLGNHEAMLLMGPKQPASGDLWHRVGGQETLMSYRIMPGARYKAEQTTAIMAVHGEFYLGLVSYHVEADTLFVHAGVPPIRHLADLDSSQDHLWIEPSAFVETTPEDLRERFGVGRVVFGHHPYLKGPAAFQDGALLGIDTGSFLPNGRISVVELLPDLAFRVVGQS